MKRWTIRILLCIILGVVTTVGVAWGLALLLDYNGTCSMSTYVYEARAGVVVYELDAFGSRLQFSPIRFRMSDSSFESLGGNALHSDFVDDPALGLRDLRGWPLLALSWSRELSAPNSTQLARHVSYGWVCDSRPESVPFGVNRSSDTGPRSVLPLRPILPGFVINTLFYAAIWFVLFFGLSAARRTIRRKRGRCPRCGYDLRGSVTNGQDARSTGQDACCTGCPECGWERAVHANS